MKILQRVRDFFNFEKESMLDSNELFIDEYYRTLRDYRKAVFYYQSLRSTTNEKEVIELARQDMVQAERKLDYMTRYAKKHNIRGTLKEKQFVSP